MHCGMNPRDQARSILKGIELTSFHGHERNGAISTGYWRKQRNSVSDPVHVVIRHNP